jgi:nitrogen regulatory protein P-II 2
MNKHPKKLLVVITEAVLETRIVADARRLGALGYTVSDVRGGGTEETREGRWEADRSIEMKVICDEATADAIAAHCLQTYGPSYRLTLFFGDVQVLRPHKFGAA